MAIEQSKGYSLLQVIAQKDLKTGKPPHVHHLHPVHGIQEESTDPSYSARLPHEANFHPWETQAHADYVAELIIFYSPHNKKEREALERLPQPTKGQAIVKNHWKINDPENPYKIR